MTDCKLSVVCACIVLSAIGACRWGMVVASLPDITACFETWVYEHGHVFTYLMRDSYEYISTHDDSLWTPGSLMADRHLGFGRFYHLSYNDIKMCRDIAVKELDVRPKTLEYFTANFDMLLALYKGLFSDPSQCFVSCDMRVPQQMPVSGNTCAHCGKAGARKICKCRTERYCNEGHQQADWARHKPTCKRIRHSTT